MASNSKINNRRVSSINNVDDIVFRGVSSILEKQSKGMWIGTMTELTKALNSLLRKRQRTMKQRTILPGSPSALRVVLNRVVNRLRNSGIGVRFVRTTDRVRTRLVRFTQ